MLSDNVRTQYLKPQTALSEKYLTVSLKNAQRLQNVLCRNYAEHKRQ